jgi:hypothetical protein
LWTNNKSKEVGGFETKELAEEFMQLWREMAHGEFANQAWDDVDYTDLEVDEDWLDKATSIVDGEDYDTRVQVPVDFTDQELLTYMKIAHERDITFNELVEEALRHAINEYNEGRIHTTGTDDPIDFPKPKKKKKDKK